MSPVKSIRHKEQPGYVIHSYPYQETSLIVELFTRDFGRLAVVAKGAKRAHSALRSVLMPFHPLTLDWSGRAELKTLRSAEWRSGYRTLMGRSLMCGFYLNELLLKLLHREDPHEQLFDYYSQTLLDLHRSDEPATVLRHFEKNLFQELGYALVLDREARTDQPIKAHERYIYVIDQGPIAARPGINGVELSGQTLIDMNLNQYHSPSTQQQSKTLMRALISHYIGHQTLYSRQLLIDLQAL
jgi:DNA repair protein RecO (recombination protein O)